MLVDLDHAQALRIELVDDRLDARGFTGTAVAEQQDVVRRFSVAERLGILHKFLLLKLISDEVIQHHGIHVVDREEADGAVSILSNAERLVETEHADTEVLVEFRHIFEEISSGLSRLKLFT